MTALNNMFAQSANGSSAVKELAGTAIVNKLAGVATDRFFEQINDRTVVDEGVTDPVLIEQATKYAGFVEESKTNVAALDELIDCLCDLDTMDITELIVLDTNVLESMLKSQQSKKSRTHSKEMTLANYTAMLTAAVAEKLIRKALGKPKTHGGARTSTSLYDEATLKMYADNQDLLRKELRNVQSKKSIEKKKADFDENSDRWNLLLVAEDQLKSVRTTNGKSTVTYVDQTKEAIREMLAEVDIDKLKKQEACDLLMSIFDLVYNDDEENAEEDQAAEETPEETNDEETPEEVAE